MILKNFTYAEEQKLIRKIWKIHDQIFSIPAKRYIFCVVDKVTAGAVCFAYHKLSERGKFLNRVQTFCFGEKPIPQLSFGDVFIVVRCECDIGIDCDFVVEKINDSEFPNRIEITTKINFFYYRQFIQLYRECMDEYKFKNNKNDVQITQIKAFEKVVESL